MDDERLIIEVEKYHFLYDPRDPLYKDIRVKERAWSEIGSVLGVPGKGTA